MPRSMLYSLHEITAARDSRCGPRRQCQRRCVQFVTALSGLLAQAAVSWFYALNHKDMAAAVAHFAPAAASMMDWYTGASAYPTFSALHCRQVSADGTTASVLCTFKELHVEPGTQADNFWTVELQRQPDGRWLITNYGTG
jgi:hypothetical protein